MPANGNPSMWHAPLVYEACLSIGKMTDDGTCAKYAPTVLKPRPFSSHSFLYGASLETRCHQIVPVGTEDDIAPSRQPAEHNGR